MQIAILLGTYNGGKYLQEQLDSFEKQSHSNWSLWASDDGSSDDTVEIIKRFAKKIGSNRIHLINGPQKGFAENFLNMVRNLDIEADGYAYSDQDDIWLVDKIERAAQFLASVPIDTPALYCSRTIYVNKENRQIGLSNEFNKPAMFCNALIQNIASGNTMVFNQAARAVLLKVDKEDQVDLHDWLTYIIVTGAGGQVFFDKKPSVRYRQHGDNLIGMNVGIKAAALRAYLLLYKGRFRRWNDQHISILQKIDNELTFENQIILQNFIKARLLPPNKKIYTLKKIGLYRQTLLGNAAFYLAALIGKV